MNHIVMLYEGNCLNVLKNITESSIDSIVTDPPYGLSFMGKKWDYDVPEQSVWEECLRVLKPGGHLLAFAGTRTQHRMAVRIEDAGFEIRDLIAWVYGSGFPKSHNLKDDWQGWGTGLKPALEPITVARKPFKGTIAANVLSHGTGALNIDDCRIGTEERIYSPKGTSTNASMIRVPEHRMGTAGEKVSVSGRWPANLIHDGSNEVLTTFPVESSVTGKRKVKDRIQEEPVNTVFTRGKNAPEYTDSGSPARFFYCAKTSPKDRHEGLDSPASRINHDATLSDIKKTHHSLNRNHHPTVKPTALMSYLCRLVTPPGGVVLDPFMGSGSTGKAAVIEGFKFIGIEKEEEYLSIAHARISFAMTTAGIQQKIIIA